MKLLLDENLPHQLRFELPGHDVYTTAYMKWSGIENGELLRVAAENGFDGVITNDRGLEHQQNIDDLPVTVVVILAKANTIEAIRPLCAAILAELATVARRQFVKISQP